MKLLYIENVASIKAESFYLSAALAAQKCGHEFHLAYNAFDADMTSINDLREKKGIYFHQIDFIRKPYDPRNIRAYKQVCDLIRKERIDVIHCNTPIGGFIGRLAGEKCRVKCVIYQAHGFHFYDGAPKKNWFIYYPIEKWLAKKTDAIITINKEDFERAKSFKLRNNGKVYYVPGVGIDLSQFEPLENEREVKRKELGLKDTDIALISMGDLIERKNYSVSVEAIAKCQNPNLQYYICGKGTEEENLKILADKFGVREQVHFLGYRKDIKELLRAADIFLFTSKQEGLARSLMEAMASGLPCVASRIRGNTDLLECSGGGFLCDVNNVEDYAEKINRLAENQHLREQMKIRNIKMIAEFDIDTVKDDLKFVYHEKLSQSWGGIV